VCREHVFTSYNSTAGAASARSLTAAFGSRLPDMSEVWIRIVAQGATSPWEKAR
jgi:hypothetical protein